jgi:hypothetical protein
MRSRRTGRKFLPAILATATMPLIMPDVGQLRQAEYDVADGVDAGLGGLLRFVDFDEAALELDLCLFEADAACARSGPRRRGPFRLP